MDSDQPSTSTHRPELDYDEVEYEDDPQNGFDDDADDTDGTIHGVDVRAHLEHNGEEYDDQTEKTQNEDEDLVQAINMFMRNEYDYNEFMRVTGGQTLEEELGSGRRQSEDEGDTGEEEEVVEEVTGEPQDDLPNVGAPIAVSERYNALPEEARLIMTQMLYGDSLNSYQSPGRNLADALKTQLGKTIDESAPTTSISITPLKQVKLEGGIASTPPTEGSETSHEPGRDRGKAKRLDALLGQANVLAARGNIADAMELLREVIRQDHKHAMAYQQIATVYEQEGELQKALQFGLLAAHLDPRTPAEDWAHWGDEAKKFGLLEEAAICYDRAVHLNNDNWKYYEKRIELLDQMNLRPLAMRTRLQAAQMVSQDVVGVDFKWFHDLIRKVAQYYITMNDEEKAIMALEAFVLRSREFGRNSDAQHETLVGMYLAKHKFQQAGKSIVALCEGVKPMYRNSEEPGCLIRYQNGTYECLPFPPLGDIEYIIDAKLFPITMHCHLLICLFCLNEYEQAANLQESLLDRNIDNKDESFILDVPRTYKNRGQPKLATKFLEGLMSSPGYDCELSGEFWYLKGTLALMQKNGDAVAMKAFEKTLALQPDHVDNRINLSSLQQKAGLFDKALDTLRDYDLENCSAIPDERLLARQADVLFEAGETEQFVKTTRMMLAPHFYQIYVSPDTLRKRRASKGEGGSPALSNTLRTSALGVVKHTNWERLVKRLGATLEANGAFASLTLSPTDIHDYCLKLIECLNKMEKHNDALIVCCYAFLHPTLFKSGKTSTFQNLVYYCAIKARSWPLAFEYVRFYYTFALMSLEPRPENLAHIDMLHKRLFNAMNYVFVNSQNVCYHRFIMRALVKAKQNHALQAISGNNSLITGTYRHAMGEYLRVWVNNKRNPLICLLLALTFTHMSCKKDLSSRHLISIRGIAFMKKYSKVRTCQQEVFYNTARMFHQMSILPLAKYFYDKVLEVEPPNVYSYDEEGNEIVTPAEKYDLRRMAAHNLALIYRTSGNHFAARDIYEKYLVV